MNGPVDIEAGAGAWLVYKPAAKVERRMRDMKLTRAICAVALLAALGGCSSVSSVLPAMSGSNSFENLLGGSKPAAPVAPATPLSNGVVAVPVGPDTRVDCPIVQVADGQAAFRAYAGADRSSSGVKYQYSFADISRECVGVPGGQIGVRVGVAGYVLAGPAGGSGNFNVPVKVTIRRESDQAVVSTKIYRVATAIPPGETQSTFSVVSDQILVPFVSNEADEDYSIYVGFDASSEAPKANPRRNRRRG